VQEDVEDDIVDGVDIFYRWVNMGNTKYGLLDCFDRFSARFLLLA
jgi:hypothetical protein